MLLFFSLLISSMYLVDIIYLWCACFSQTMESIDAGKPFAASYLADIPGAVKSLRYCAGWADKNHGRTIPMGMF